MSKSKNSILEMKIIFRRKPITLRYARSNGFKNIRHFADDGYSGTNFNRPAIQELLTQAVQAAYDKT